MNVAPGLGILGTPDLDPPSFDILFTTTVCRTSSLYLFIYAPGAGSYLSLE
jgi:hypothetical protein